MLTPENKSQAQEYAAECKQKLDALPARIAAEKEAAAKEGRKPYKIVPLIELDPAVMGPVIEHIGNAPDDVAETFGVIRHVCANQNLPFNMRCDQLAAVLALLDKKPE
jgi:hypothetical protein